MNSPKLNETKADKEPLGKIFWFLWLPWFVLLLLIILINVYQKEGIIHQDDLGNTVFSKVKTGVLFALVGGPIYFLFFAALFGALLQKINKEPFSGFNYVVVLPLTVLICASVGIFAPYWTSLKFDNKAKVLILIELPTINAFITFCEFPLPDNTIKISFSLAFTFNCSEKIFS